jgi:glycerophosphoryl diester phosphodiesterase
MPSADAPTNGHDNPWIGRRVLCGAHRGGSLEVPENTMAAFRRAVALGSDMLELDVWAAADDEVVCIHDPTLERTTNGRGRVADLSLDEIRTLDAAHWFVPDVGADASRPPDDYPLRGVATGERPPPEGIGRPEDLRVPALREVLEAFPDTLLTIEVKGTAPEVPPYEDHLARLLEEYGRGADVIIGSFREEALAALQDRLPDLPTSVPPSEARAFLEAAGGGGEAPRESSRQALQLPVEWEGTEVVSPEVVELAHEVGLAVHVWTVNEEEAIRRFVGMGVDGILSDRPSLLRRVLNELQVAYG